MYPYPYILQGDNLTIVIGNQSHSINRETHPKFEKIMDAIRADEWDKVEQLVDMTSALRDYVSDGGDIEVRDGNVYFQGRPFHNALADRLIEMLKQDFPVAPLCAFLENLKQNPSKRAVDELYGFLEKNNLPITPDGHFLAYKRVRGDFKDIHSGTFDNSPGKVCEMPRNEVDEDKDSTCSTGLHFCSLEYLPSFGSYGNNRVVILKINPRDVVSIPSDYNNAKGRCCRYEVVAEHGVENADRTEAFDTVVQDDNDLRTGDGPELRRPREVRQDSLGQWRYAPGNGRLSGQFATKADIDAWMNHRYFD